MNFSVIIMAAGMGKRMHSTLPKVLHPLAGRPLLSHLFDAVTPLKPQQFTVVVGYEGERVRQHYVGLASGAQFTHSQHASHSNNTNCRSHSGSPCGNPAHHAAPSLNIAWTVQSEQRGTGHAVQQALPHLPKEPHAVLILVGDIPLIQTDTLRKLVESTPSNALGILTAKVQDPTGLGRIVRGPGGQVQAIVEDKDASPEVRKIHEINSGILLIPSPFLHQHLPHLTPNNKQQELYLTDLIAVAVRENVPIHTVTTPHEWEVQGVNTRNELAVLERTYQWAEARRLMSQGVTLLDPARIDLRGSVEIGTDVVIDINVILEGPLQIESGVSIGPHCVIKNSVIRKGCVIEAHSVIEGAEIGENCTLGPFARVRPGTRLAEAVRIGNFVELKKAEIGTGSKVNHLSYIGDATLGERVNIGAGTITCNFDGIQKHPTVIGDEVFIGSGTQLIAPIEIGKGACVGAGTTVLRDAPAGQLTINPKTQITKSPSRKGSKDVSLENQATAKE